MCRLLLAIHTPAADLAQGSGSAAPVPVEAKARRAVERRVGKYMLGEVLGFGGSLMCVVVWKFFDEWTVKRCRYRLI